MVLSSSSNRRAIKQHFYAPISRQSPVEARSCKVHVAAPLASGMSDRHVSLSSVRNSISVSVDQGGCVCGTHPRCGLGVRWEGFSERYPRRPEPVVPKTIKTLASSRLAGIHSNSVGCNIEILRHGKQRHPTSNCSDSFMKFKLSSTGTSTLSDSCTSSVSSLKVTKYSFRHKSRSMCFKFMVKGCY